MLCTPKHNAYWITFFAYAAIHSLRMCYSFNKVSLKRQFQLSQFHLGFLDAVMYISLSLGTLLRYEIFDGNQNMKKVYLATAMMISSCFGMIAYVALMEEMSIMRTRLAKVLLTIAVGGFGFFHMAAYQICGAVVSGYYDSNRESSKLGFWGSSSSVGNIIGFFVSNMVIYQFELMWQVTFFIFSIVSLMMAFVVYFVLDIAEQDESYKQELYSLVKNRGIQLPQKQTHQLEITNNKLKSPMSFPRQEIGLIHWYRFIQHVTSGNTQLKYTFAAYITTKATVYTFLTWFPIFLVSRNLESVSGYISTLFDFGGTIGGFAIGFLQRINYVTSQNREEGRSSVFSTILKFRNVLFILIVTGIIISFMVVDSSLAVYCPLTFFIGFFLGGTFNNISSHQIFKIAQSRMLYTEMLLSLPIVISCFMVGVLQLITAFLLKWNKSSVAQGGQTNYGVFFMVLLAIMVACAGIMCKRVYVQNQNGKNMKITE